MGCRWWLAALSVAILIGCNSGERKSELGLCAAGCPANTVCGIDGTCVPVTEEPAPAVDPCADATCDPMATCDGTTGQAVCTCPAGYEDVNGDGTLCADIDECLGGTPVCGQHATCGNTPGSFTCACEKGYAGDPMVGCANIDECAGPTAVCGPRANCTDEEGSFTCTCQGGYKGDAYDLVNGCADVNECAGAVCGANAVCENNAGSFSCQCSPGFAGNPNDLVTGCVDINECATNTDDCDANAACGNTTGSFTCRCNGGWSGNGRTCTDIDECATGNGGCSGNATCTNTPGSRTCACNGGFTGNGLVCTDIDECALGTDRCDDAPLARCTNTTGSHACTCPAAFDDPRSSGALCLPTGDGHVVLVASDLADEKLALPFRPLLVNAVKLGHLSQRIGYFVEFARFGTPQADVPLKLLGLTRSQVRPLGAGDLDRLYEIDVLIVPDQVAADKGQLAAIGDKVRQRLQDFVYAGGVIIVLDARGDTAGMMRGAGLVDATYVETAPVAPFSIVGDPVTVGVTTIPRNAGHFHTGDAILATDGREVIYGANRNLDDAVVVHKAFTPIGDFELARNARPGPTWQPLGTADGKTDVSLRLHGGLGWTDSDWFLEPTRVWGSRELEGDRLTFWFRPVSDAFFVELGFNDDGKAAQVVRASTRGLQAFATDDHKAFSARSEPLGQVTLGGWHKLEVRWERAVLRARMTQPDGTRTDIMFKTELPPAGVSFRVKGAEVDSLIGSAESR